MYHESPSLMRREQEEAEHLRDGLRKPPAKPLLKRDPESLGDLADEQVCQLLRLSIVEVLGREASLRLAFGTVLITRCATTGLSRHFFCPLHACVQN